MIPTVFSTLFHHKHYGVLIGIVVIVIGLAFMPFPASFHKYLHSNQ